MADDSASRPFSELRDAMDADSQERIATMVAEGKGEVVFMQSIGTMVETLALVGVVGACWVFEQKGDTENAELMKAAIMAGGGLERVEDALAEVKALIEAIA